MFTDTLIASVPSYFRQNKCAQVFGMRNGWTRAFPLRSKGDAHQGLSTMFAEDGVPAEMVMNGAKDQLMGEFRKKCREASCYVKQTEPHSPWSNHAETSIKELKKAVARCLVATKAPIKLWDHCLEFRAFV